MNLKNTLVVAKEGIKYFFSQFLKYTKNSPRLLLGSLFLIVGLNSFFSFFNTPDAAPASITFLMGLSSAPYFFPLLKGLEVVCGLLLLFNRYITLALVALAPVVVNIVAFHAYLEPNNYVLGAAAAVLYVLVVLQNRKSLSFLLKK